MLSKIGAMETIRSHFHSLAAWSSEESRERADSGLVTHITIGSIPQPAPPTPRFAALQNRLAAAGIAATLVDGQLRFRLQPPSGEAIELAQPVRHPWLGEHGLTRVGAPEVGVDNLFPYTVPIRRRERQLPNASKTLHLPEFEAVVRANEKLSQLMANQAPAALCTQAFAQLEARIQSYFAALLMPEDLRFDSRVAFSGRSVLAPGAILHHDQVGLAEEMAWTLYGPQVIHQLNQAGVDGQAAVADRTSQATQLLDEVMTHSWVIVHRIPTVFPPDPTLAPARPIRG